MSGVNLIWQSIIYNINLSVNSYLSNVKDSYPAIRNNLQITISSQITMNNTNTGKSLSEALIFASTNPQYDDRLFSDWITSSIHENSKL